ncbi:MAG: PLP-dependent aminotransferase family protein, partial [Hyphomicrobiales bacterium]|nr:PLP-dependent aminotransferase family protein [Hyphomicrobiales bacterium]
MDHPFWSGLALDRTLETPLPRQLYDALRAAIAARILRAGVMLPSSRRVAQHLGIGRNSVIAAYEQLAIEGYVQTRTGQGTWVAEITEQLPGIGSGAGDAAVRPALSRTGRMLTSFDGNEASTGRAFRPGVPDARLFPHDLWARLLRRAARRTGEIVSGYGFYDGHPELKRAIVDYLAAARGVAFPAENVMVMSSAQAALDLMSRLLLDPGDTVWIEEPGYWGARVAFAGAGASLVPMPVDGRGADPSGVRSEVPPRLIYATPSHQYPTGATMDLDRR